MRAMARRRAAFLTVTALLAVTVVVAWSLARAALRPADELTGWALLGLCVFLGAFNLRKKLPMLPLGSASTWLQLHVYAGYLALLVFLLHLELAWPHGALETLLAALFLFVAGTGVVGLWLSRGLASVLAGMGDRVLYERIPRERAELRRRAEALALESIDVTGEQLLARFHVERLHDYFGGRRDQLRHLLGLRGPEGGLVEGLEGIGSYQEDDGRRIVDRMIELVREKARLDKQLALQHALRYWLFFHVPATYVLYVAITLHVALVLGYGR